jgi:mono/diheme cytochrome c family protein
MSLRFLNLMLLVCLGLVTALNWVVEGDPGTPNREFLPEMTRSVPYDSFAPNSNFADGKTLRTPVAGTIPRGFAPIHYQATEADAARAGEELQNPFAADDESEPLPRGTAMFNSMCLPCHGPAGRGDGPVAMRGYPAPPSLLADEARNKKDGQMFHIITYGQGNMPPHAGQISREDRCKVILHIRSLQQKALQQSTEPASQP